MAELVKLPDFEELHHLLNVLTELSFEELPTENACLRMCVCV